MFGWRQIVSNIPKSDSYGDHIQRSAIFPNTYLYCLSRDRVSNSVILPHTWTIRCHLKKISSFANKFGALLGNHAKSTIFIPARQVQPLVCTNPGTILVVRRSQYFRRTNHTATKRTMPDYALLTSFYIRAVNLPNNIASAVAKVDIRRTFQLLWRITITRTWEQLTSAILQVIISTAQRKPTALLQTSRFRFIMTDSKEVLISMAVWYTIFYTQFPFIRPSQNYLQAYRHNDKISKAHFLYSLKSYNSITKYCLSNTVFYAGYFDMVWAVYLHHWIYYLAPHKLNSQ